MYYPLVSRKAASFVLDHVAIHKDETGICFAYSPIDETRVYNSSLFAAKILVRAMEHDPDNEEKYRELACEACDYVAARQNSNGSWVYGEASHWKWTDNLHTGFVLETLEFISKKIGTGKYRETVENGLRYYRTNLFKKDWKAKYLNKSEFPLYPHSFAQSAITFINLSEYTDDSLKIAGHILTQAIRCLWDNEQGGFVYRKHRFWKQKTVYLRWSQGWMFKALSKYLEQVDANMV
jgi:hypothetical protein